jgi:hypothetical protein
MSETNKTTEVNETVTIDPIAARLDEIETNLKGTIDRQVEVIEQQAKDIQDLKNRPNNNSSDDVDDGAILIDRQSAHTMSLPVVDGVPIISGKLERVIGVKGLEYLMNVETADGEKHSFPFGCNASELDFTDKRLKDVKTTSYEGIKTKDFKLQDVDTNDLTGASKIQKGEIVGEGNVIPEVDRSSGRPQLTGRKIRTVVRSDVRHYTIEYGGEKFTLSSEQLGNIRI